MPVLAKEAMTKVSVEDREKVFKGFICTDKWALWKTRVSGSAGNPVEQDCCEFDDYQEALMQPAPAGIVAVGKV